MSFYGNILYELTNAFSRVLIQNNGTDKKDFITPSTESVEIPAIGLGGKLELDTGNKWISIQGNPEEHSCTIYHAAKDASDITNQMSTIAKTENNTGAIELAPGDYLKGAVMYYDEAGHVTSADAVYYRLPISETEEELADLQARMTAIEESDIAQTGLINQNTADIEAVTTAHDETVADLAALDKRVGNMYNLTAAVDKLTITQALGRFDTMQEQTAYPSVCEGLTSLKQSVDAQNASISDASLVQRVVIKNLCDQIAAQSDIEIDYDALWTTTT